MIWLALVLVAALGAIGPDCHQGATVFDGVAATTTPQLQADCKF